MMYNATMDYEPSTLLFKVNKLKLVKGERLHSDVGVVKQNGRSLAEVGALLAGKNTDKATYEVREVWVGWTVQGVDVTDGWLITKYGLLKDDLSDA